MNKYELMYVIDTGLEENARQELIEKTSALIAANGGTVEKVEEWGKRRLAYAINYKTEGYYVLVNFSAGSEVPQEIQRVLQISEDVLRYLVVKLEEKHTGVKPRAVPVRPAPRFADSAAEPEAPAESPEAPAAEAPAAEEPAAPAEAPAEE